MFQVTVTFNVDPEEYGIRNPDPKKVEQAVNEMVQGVVEFPWESLGRPLPEISCAEVKE